MKEHPLPLSILIVEDEQPVREAIGRLISRKYPEVVVYLAGNGKEGVTIFRQNNPRIVITDINMPEMDGVTMAHAIRSLEESTRFIVTSASSDDRPLDEMAQIGVQEFVPKPLDLSRLISAIEKCL